MKRLLMKRRVLLHRVVLQVGCAVCATVLASSSVQAQRHIDVPSSVYAERRAQLFENADDAVIVAAGEYLIRRGGSGRQDLDFWYLTGVESPYSALVIHPDGSPDGRHVLFLPDSFQFAGAQYSFPDDRLRRAGWNRTFRNAAPGPEAADRLAMDEVLPIDEFSDYLRDAAAGNGLIQFVGSRGSMYAPPGMPAPRSARQQFYDGVRDLLGPREYRDLSDQVARMRLVKDEHEIAAIREAARISSLSLVEVLTEIRPGANDLEIAGFMEYVWKREGASRTAFSPIVASGESSVGLYTLRSELYNSTDRVMGDGELVFIDYGAAEFDMYGSDICRTFPVNGRFDDEQRRIYEIVLEAQEAALAKIRPGVMMVEVIQAAAAVFQAHGLQQYEDIDRMGAQHVWGLMPSPTYWIDGPGVLTDYSGARGTGIRDLGHHIGLDATDSRDYTIPLEPGMVFTVEPKIYVPDSDIAIMIEDMILVTEDGYENLSADAPKSIAEIERLMGR